MTDATDATDAERPGYGQKGAVILDAAIACFTESGFAKTRIATIAKRAGVGKGTVYEYHRSKEDLLLAACLNACDHSETRMAELLGQQVDLSGRMPSMPTGVHPVKAAHGLLHAVLVVMLPISHTEQRLFSELINLAAQDPVIGERARAEFATKIDQWIAQADMLYDAGRSTGYFRDLPQPRDASRLIVAAVDGLIWQRWWTEEPPVETAQRIADTWMRLLLREPQRLEEFLE